MGKLIINGGQKLKGEINIQGSKNAVLPILSATILNNRISVIKNCPTNLKDVQISASILRSLGAKVEIEDDVMTIDTSTINKLEIPDDLATQMRASIIYLGSMLAKFNKVTICYPGGCEIGPRPVDLHLKALKQMGVSTCEIHNGLINCESQKLVGADIHLDYPSVGATENIMLTAVFAEGDTFIKNASKEPEIVDLQNFLNTMGAKVFGAGSNIIKIHGIPKINFTTNLSDIEYRVIPDRIAAGTYLIAAGITNGNIQINNAMPEHMGSIISNLRDIGCHINIKKNSMRVKGPLKPKSIDIIRTLPYPGFPTDMQAQIISLLSVAQGTSILSETVFENRFRHVDELLKMGANIRVKGNLAIIKGVKLLSGANVNARDLRGGAALVLAGLVAEGETTVNDITHVERGYVNIDEILNSIGASIKKIT